MYAAKAKKQRPTVLNASRSFRSRRSTFASTLRRHSRAAPEVTSIKLSMPNPTREMLPAASPAMTATTPSRQFHTIVKYSSLRPRPAIATRSTPVSPVMAGYSGNSSNLRDGPILISFLTMKPILLEIVNRLSEMGTRVGALEAALVHSRQLTSGAIERLLDAHKREVESHLAVLRASIGVLPD